MVVQRYAPPTYLTILCMHPSGISCCVAILQGFGVCEFTNPHDAKEAIQNLDETTLQGQFAFCAALVSCATCSKLSSAT